MRHHQSNHPASGDSQANQGASFPSRVSSPFSISWLPTSGASVRAGSSCKLRESSPHAVGTGALPGSADPSPAPQTMPS
jgi:hypothetical protein